MHVLTDLSKAKMAGGLLWQSPESDSSVQSTPFVHSDPHPT